LGGREVWKYWKGGRFGTILSPVMNVFLELHEDSICYLHGDSRTERLVHSITVVLHVVQIHSNISIYYSVVHHVRILEQKPSWRANTATSISSDRDEEY
jgi:hypothetical protein